MRLVEMSQTIVPAETHFVTQGTTYIGILSFWIVAKVRNDKGTTTWQDAFPIVANGESTIEEQIESDGKAVYHWSEMRHWLINRPPDKDADGTEEDVQPLLRKLWGEDGH